MYKLMLFLILLSGPSAHPFLVYYGDSLSRSEIESYELSVLDATHYPNVQNYKGRQLAYLSIGEIEKNRSWYQPMLDEGILLQPNPVWPDARYVSLKEDLWLDEVLKHRIPALLEKGYDGVFFDTLDSLETSGQSPKAVEAFLEAIRKAFPKTFIMANRGFTWLQALEPDAVLLESTYSTLDFQSHKHRELQLEQPDIADGIERYCLNYWDYSEPKMHRELYKRAETDGCISLVSHHSLQVLPLIHHSKEALPAVHQYERKVTAFYDSRENEDSQLNNLHTYIEVAFNRLGYYLDFYDLAKPATWPSTTQWVALWPTRPDMQNPRELENYLETQTRKHDSSLIWLGYLPDSAKIQELLGVQKGNVYVERSNRLKTLKKPDYWDYEIPLNSRTLQAFETMKPTTQTAALLTLKVRSHVSSPVIKGPRSLYAQGEAVFYRDPTRGHRWIANPIRLLSEVLPTDFPVPDLTTTYGRRNLIIHIDGDGSYSISEVKPGHYNARVALDELIEPYGFKTGVSYIGFEIDPQYRGNKVLQSIVEKTFRLANVETSSHTYSHPFSWQNGLVAFSVQKEATKALYTDIQAFREPGGKINLPFEIDASIDFLNQFAPPKKPIQTLYWSGDCKPVENTLRYLRERNILAMNGGDSRLDTLHPSIAYLWPIGRDVGNERQIYSPGSNENTYTELWTDRFGNFELVLETWKNTEKRGRLDPINLYYHFYAAEKRQSFEAMQKIYQWLDQRRDSLYEMFPSTYIQMAQDWYSLQIQKIGNRFYRVESPKRRINFRIPDALQIRSTSNTGYLDKTYLTLEPAVSHILQRVP